MGIAQFLIKAGVADIEKTYSKDGKLENAIVKVLVSFRT